MADFQKAIQQRDPQPQGTKVSGELMKIAFHKVLAQWHILWYNVHIGQCRSLNFRRAIDTSVPWSREDVG